MNLCRRIAVVAPLLLWFGLLMPAHRHADERAMEEHAVAEATASAGAPDRDHDAPGHDDHHRRQHDCTVCHFGANLATITVEATPIAALDVAERLIGSTPETLYASALPRPFDGRAPPPSVHA